MLAKELLNDGILPLQTTDSGKIALEWMEDYRLSHLPVTDGSKLVGLISEWDIYNFEHPEDPIGQHQNLIQNISVTEDQHLYEVMRLVQMHQLSLVPVVDGLHVYQGSVTIQGLVEQFSRSLSAAEPGGIIILHVNVRDYVLSEIARIVESDDARILSLFIHHEPLAEKLRLTIKVNKREIRGLLQTFARFNYEVLMSFGSDDDSDDLRERYNALMSYLGV